MGESDKLECGVQFQTKEDECGKRAFYLIHGYRYYQLLAYSQEAIKVFLAKVCTRGPCDEVIIQVADKPMETIIVC